MARRSAACFLALVMMFSTTMTVLAAVPDAGAEGAVEQVEGTAPEGDGVAPSGQDEEDGQDEKGGAQEQEAQQPNEDEIEAEAEVESVDEDASAVVPEAPKAPAAGEVEPVAEAMGIEADGPVYVDPQEGDVTLIPRDDTTLHDSAANIDKPQGNTTQLVVKDGGAAYSRRSALQFDVSGIEAGNVESAKLYLYIGRQDNGGNRNNPGAATHWGNRNLDIAVWATTATGWSEQDLSWNVAKALFNMPELLNVTTQNGEKVNFAQADAALVGEIPVWVYGKTGDVEADEFMNDLGWVELDMTSYLNSYEGDLLSLVLVGQTSSQAMIMFDSKEGQNPPRLVVDLIEAPVVPEDVELAPTDDTYIYDGAKGAAYGDATILKIKDSDPGYTRRALLQFDVSEVDKEQLTNATLSLYVAKRDNGDAWDKPASNAYEGGKEFELAVWATAVTGWTEASFTWNSAEEPAFNMPGYTSRGEKAEFEEGYGELAGTFKMMIPAAAENIGKTQENLGWIEADLTEFLKGYEGDTLSLMLIGAHGQIMLDIASKEGTNAPVLAIGYGAVEPTDPTAEQESWETLRENWARRLTGAAIEDQSHEDVVQSVKEIYETAQGYWGTMVPAEGRVTIWPDLTNQTKGEGSTIVQTGELSFLTSLGKNDGKADSYLTENIGATYQRLQAMAVAWATPGDSNPLYHNEEMLADILSALDWLADNVYLPGIRLSRAEGTQLYGNWYHWYITVPRALGDTLVLLYGELEEDFIAKQYKSLDTYCNDSFYPFNIYNVYGDFNKQTGSNLAETSLISLLKQAIGEKGDSGRSAGALGQIIGWADGGDGFYPDGSMLDHGGLAYTAGYGVSLLRAIERMLCVLDGTMWQQPEEVVGPLFSWLTDAYLPLLTNGAIMDMTKGRGIARPGKGDVETARGVIQPIVHLLQYAEESDRALLLSAVKYTAAEGTAYYESMGEDYFSGMSTFDRMTLRAVVGNEAIVPGLPTEYTKVFGAMDKVVVHRAGFTLGISMYSNRTGSFEYGNGENRRGWHISDGALYLYQGDMAQYADSYWPTVDPYRLAGTTADGTEGIIPDKWELHKSDRSFAGGSSLDGYYASIGQDLHIENSSTEALKSWFVFDDFVVAVGSRINSREANMVETIVENRKLDGGNTLVVDGVAVAASKTVPGASWAWLSGNVSGGDTGWYFPGGTDIAVARGDKTGAWSDINSSAGISTEKISREYMSLAVEHGVKPQDESYAYVLLPGYSQEQTAAFAEENGIEILRQDERAHVVADAVSGITGMNFFKPAGEGFVAALDPASVTMRDAGNGTYVLAVSDPAHRNGATRIKLFDHEWTIVDKPEGVTVAFDGEGYPTLLIPTQGSYGASFEVTVQRGESKPGGRPEETDEPEPPVTDNLIRNGGFEETSPVTATSGGVDWQLWENDTKASEWMWQRYPADAPTANYNGSFDPESYSEEAGQSVRLDVVQGASGQQGIFKQDKIEVQAGTTLDFSFMYKMQDVAGASIVVRIEEYNGVASGHTERHTVGTIPAGTTDWKEFTGTLTTKDDTAYVMLVILFNSGAHGSLWLDDVTLKEQYIAVESVYIEGGDRTLVAGQSTYLTAGVLPTNAFNKGIVWDTSDPDVATIEDGRLVAVAEGSATISVHSEEDPEITASITVTVRGEVFEIEQRDLSLQVGDKRFLTYIDTEGVADEAPALWSSANEAVARVGVNGLLEAVGVGNTTITLKSADGNHSDSVAVTVAENNTPQDYVTMRGRWLERILGGDKMDLGDSHIASYVATLSANADAAWESLDRSEGRQRLWAETGVEIHVDYHNQFKSLLVLAQAFGTEGTNLTGDAEVYEAIMAGLDFMTGIDKSSPFKYDGSYDHGNWWEWQIGCAQAFTDTLMILADYIEADKMKAYTDIISGYAADPARQWPNTTATGANLTDIALSVLGTGILMQDDARLDLVKLRMPNVLGIVTAGDGFYADGSYVQHTNYAYTASYGNELIKGVGRILNVIADTAWAIEAEELETFYENVEKAFLPVVYNGKMMANLGGRSITRYREGGMELSAGNGTMANLMVLANGAPEKYRSLYQSAVKYWVEQALPYYDYFRLARDLETLLNYKALLHDDSIEARQPFTGTHVYGSMDRVVSANPGYTLAISMYSKRIANYEYGTKTGENGMGWHTGSGMLWLYNADMAQYTEAFWPTMDWYRLPGTTVETVELARGQGYGARSGNSWIGGATDGEVASVGMVYNTEGNTKSLGLDTYAHKSWFLLDGQIIALGTGITGGSNGNIETTVENRMLNEDGSNPILVNGAAFDGQETVAALEAGSWVHMQGSVAGADIGYVFPEAAELTMLTEERSGTYKELDPSQTNTDVFTANYLKLILDHGQNVEDDTYYYVMLPGAGAAETAAYAREHDLRVLQNDTDLQALYADGVLFMNVWAANGAEIEGYSADKSAAMVLRREGDVFTLTVAEPKQNGQTVTVGLPGAITEIVSVSSDKVSAVVGSDTVKIDTAGAAGASFQISFRMERALEGISLKKAETTLSEGLTEQMVLITDPIDATGLPEAVWASSNTGVATVDANGLVTATAPGQATIKVQVGGFEATCAVTVVARVLVGIEIAAQPAKTVYAYGEALELEGLVVTALYDNGTSGPVEGYQVSGYDAKAPGMQQVAVSFGGKTATFTVMVKEKAPEVELTGIRIVKQPAKVEYLVGEKLDLTGLVVEAVFSDGSTRAIESYSVSGFDPAKAGTVTVTVAALGHTAGFTVVVKQPEGGKYEITSGGSPKYDGKNVTIVIDGDFDSFTDLWVNGKLLVRDVDYTARPGSVIITLLDSWLKTLEPGTYAIDIEFKDGVVTTVMKVDEPGESGREEDKAPDTAADAGNRTGDAANTLPWIFAGLAALGCLVAAVVVRRRRAKKAE